jgi:prepilin-type processing-associated H-X9-DG protein
MNTVMTKTSPYLLTETPGGDGWYLQYNCSAVEGPYLNFSYGVNYWIGSERTSGTTAVRTSGLRTSNIKVPTLAMVTMDIKKANSTIPSYNASSVVYRHGNYSCMNIQYLDGHVDSVMDLYWFTIVGTDEYRYRWYLDY